MKRVSLRRKPRADTDKVTPELANDIYERDRRMCVAYQLDPGHSCRSRWDGTPHLPSEQLTIEHVKRTLGMSMRAESRAPFLVLLCGGANVGVPSKELRARLRQYLSDLYPDEWREAA